MPHAAVYTELTQSCPVHYACAFVRLRDNKLICYFSHGSTALMGLGLRDHTQTHNTQ